jgi:Domain of unknown function (DUF4270)
MTINYYLKKERILPLYPFFFLAILFIVSCQKQPVLNFGSSFVVDNSTAHIILVDTSTIDLATVYTDSSSTAGSGFLLVGTYTDLYLGKISSRAFLQVAPPPGLPTITSADSYDSIGLIMLYKKGNPFYGDTTLQQSFTINQVDTQYVLGDFRRGFFSNSSFPLDPASLGTSSATIAPDIPYTSQRAGDSIKIKMPDALGRTLYNMIFNNSDTITKQQNWLKYFHGLCISPGPGSQGAIYGFNDSATMRIYYHEVSVYSTQKFIDFTITNKGFQFNNITVDRTGSPTANLINPTRPGQTPPATTDSLLGHAAYAEGPLGLSVKLTFPNLITIAHRPDYISVLRATLIVRPVPNSFTTTWRLPPQLTLFVTDQNNLPSVPLGSTTSGGLQGGNMTVDFLNPLNTFYAYDVTNFIKTQIINTSINANQTGLMLTVPPPASTTQFNRAVLADFTYPVLQRATLQVYYISLYPHQ